MENVCEVTEGRTLLVITQVSSGLKNHIFSSLANIKYLHVKIASLVPGSSPFFGGGAWVRG